MPLKHGGQTNGFRRAVRAQKNQGAGMDAVTIGRAANNCTTCFGDFKHKSELFSISRGDYTENSPDLSSGRRPTSKSDEF